MQGKQGVVEGRRGHDTDIHDVGTLARLLTRDELKAVCRAHGLEDAGRSRTELASRLIGGAFDLTPPPAPLFARAPQTSKELPEKGDIVQVRHRQYLVEDVLARPLLGEATRVRLVCLDDDNQGRPLEVLWELELGARVLQPETHGLGEVRGLDPPNDLAAYLHALRWHAVTATDARLFQAPFRAGIQLMNHQLTPLIDESLALIGSANFTHNAQARNIEVGVLIDDPSFAHDLVRQWQGLIEAGLVLGV